MGIYTRPDSPFLWWSLTIDGHRFRGCCGTASRDEARRLLKAKGAELRRLHASEGGKRQMTIEATFTRYADEHAIRLVSAGDIARIGEIAIAALGPGTLLSRVSPDDIARFVAGRRMAVSDSSVNRELTIIRAVLRMAAQRWGIDVAPIAWNGQFLLEPAPRSRILSATEEARLFAELRPDFLAVIRFTLATGVRRANALRLRWREVDLEAGLIRLRVKSRRPGGDLHTIPITREVAAILSAERGRHPEYVFTYRPQRARSEARRALERAGADPKGLRLPFTRDGWRKSWAKALQAAGIEDFRFHDLRHTRGTRLYLQTGNLRLVQKLLGHRSIQTTMRYENSGIEDLRAALEEEGVTGVRSRKPG